MLAPGIFRLPTRPEVGRANTISLSSPSPHGIRDSVPKARPAQPRDPVILGTQILTAGTAREIPDEARPPLRASGDMAIGVAHHATFAPHFVQVFVRRIPASYGGRLSQTWSQVRSRSCWRLQVCSTVSPGFGYGTHSKQRVHSRKSGRSGRASASIGASR